MIRGGRNIPLEKSDRKYIYCRTHGPCLWHFPSADPIYLCAMILSCVFKEKGLSAVHQPNRWCFKHFLGFPGGASGREPPANAGDGRHMGSIPGAGGTPGGENGNPLHGRGILAWRIPWTEEPGRLQSIGPQKVRRNWTDLAHLHAHKHFLKDLSLSFYSWRCWVIDWNELYRGSEWGAGAGVHDPLPHSHPQ